MDYFIAIADLILISFITAQSFNLVLGYTGMIHVGHIGFMAIGAYTGSLLALAGVPFLVSASAGVLAATAAGLLLGFPTVRLREDYLVAGTLGMGEIIRLILLNERSLTGGSFGLTKIVRPQIFGISLQGNWTWFFFLTIVTAVALALIWKIVHSPFGKTLESIREDEIAALSLGINARLKKLQILVLAAAFAGLSGVLYSHTTQFIEPEGFGIPRMIFIFLIVVFGGTGKFWGPIVGSIILYVSFEAMRFLPLSPAILGPLRWILYSTLLITMIILRPKGLLGEKLERKKL